MDKISLCIAPCEEMGRRINSSKTLKQVRRGNAPARLFLQECIYVSVDRLIPNKVICASRIALEYYESHGRNFYGWAAIDQATIKTLGYGLRASPQCDNKFHADIILPPTAQGKKAMEKHATILAAKCKWRDKEVT